jgi:hypothetical protein
MAAETPILPAHIEETISAIAKLHADQHQEAGTLQRLVEGLTARMDLGTRRHSTGSREAWAIGALRDRVDPDDATT